MRLLVIDDEEDICDVVAEVARDRGFEADSISDTSGVSDKLTAFAPEAIMMDLMMPGIDGVELMRLLAEKAKGAKVCLMSGSDARVLNSARRLGNAHGLDVVAILEKPIEIPVLRGILDSFSGGKERMSGGDVAYAISHGQMVMHYQPIIELTTRRVKGVEALVRWQHPLRGTLMPSDFMDQIDGEGLIQPLTDHVLGTSLAQAAKWHNSGEDLTMSVNITASSLLELSLPDKLSEMCAKLGLPQNKLILEVTENEAMRDVTRTMDVLLRMRIREIGVAIDDFGTGHSSLRELQRMPFSEMKMDQSFVTDMADSRDCEVIVKSIIDLGHNLGLKVTAEGVESDRVWQMLLEKGCDYAQGFFMGKPMKADDFDEWLKKWRSEKA